jgi:mannose-6-phosphate isomerase-like protein (cupin superfamily)
MNYKPINLKDRLSKFDDLWSPRVIAEMNDYQFKLAKAQGDFVWHKHADTDEVFIVIEGTLEIEFREGKVVLNEGEMYVIPKGVEHKPSAKGLVKILLVEPRGIVNTGAVGGDLTAENDIWV